MRTAILVSGRGSNMQALIAAASFPDFPAEVVAVVANRPEAAALDRAGEAGLPTMVVDHRGFADRESFESAIEAQLRERAVELVCLAGFMRLLSDGFTTRWRDKLLNIHPSLLPAFKGLDVHRRVLAAGVRITGCTVHFVRPAMDEGPILVQAAVPVHRDDSEASLAARVLAAEHRCYPAALRLVASGRVRVVDEVCRIDGVADAGETILNPMPA